MCIQNLKTLALIDAVRDDDGKNYWKERKLVISMKLGIKHLRLELIVVCSNEKKRQ